MQILLPRSTRHKPPRPEPFTIKQNCIELRPRHAIDVPTEYADNGEFTERWNLALHEAGHAIAAVLTVGCGGMGIERFGSYWKGVCYDQASQEQSTYRVAIAGVSGEAVGKNLSFLPFESSDFICARNELRALGDSEASIVRRIAVDASQMADEFSKRWTKAIRELCIQVCKRSWLNGEQIAEIMGQSQAVLTKSLSANGMNKWDDLRPVQKPVKMNVYAPEVKAAMKKRGLIPVAEARARSGLRELDAQYKELTTRQDRIDAPVQGKVMKAIFKTRVLDFGQIPWTKKPDSLFKERKK